jgi:predicted Zn finger-like uncharacterized protein
MAMVTTCPHCTTSFNVEPQVLLSRNGRVRCGKCKQIFDGLLAATTLEEFQAAARETAAAEPATPQVTGLAELPLPPPPPPYWPELPEAPEVPVPPMPLEVAAAASPAYLPDPPQEALPPEPAPPTPPAPPAYAAHHGAHLDDRGAWDESDDDAAPDVPPRARWPWAIAAMLAALTLAGQVVYRYRSDLAAQFPVVKPALVQMCAWAGCGVPPLQQIASLNIEASDLQVVDKARPHLVQLTATLRNRAAIDVGYPAVDLVLTDNRDHTLARRVIVPAEYLPGAQPELAVIAANAEITMRVDMDITGLPAAGFRLNLAPAPAR